VKGSSSWAALPTRFWFGLRTLAWRGRFFTGKASFVAAQVRLVTNAVAEVYDRRGQPLGQRLLSHHRLQTQPPRTGSQGWALFARTYARPAGDVLVSLQCGYCGHIFMLTFTPAGPDSAVGTADAQPASYASDWFTFMHSSYQGEPSLSCPHCEQRSIPHVSYLNRP
jgi:hypothetical protein